MKKYIIVILLVAVSVGRAQDSLSTTDGFSIKPEFTGRKVIATSAIGGLLALSIYWSYDSWWRNAGGGFRFITQDWLNGYSSGIDKVGHFYTSYFYFHLFRNILLWGGYEPSTAEWWAFGGSAFFALVVEMGDGLTPEYGFDYQDLVFNIGGLGYGFLQSRVPFLKDFNFKWSYVPDGGYKFPIRLTEHYDDHTYWLSCNVNNLLPASIEPYWPDWLNIAVGMGVDDNWTKREFVFGFDLNLQSLFNTKNEDLLLLEKTVDMFHIPGPAIKFTERKEPRYYLFHRN